MTGEATSRYTWIFHGKHDDYKVIYDSPRLGRVINMRTKTMVAVFEWSPHKEKLTALDIQRGMVIPEGLEEFLTKELKEKIAK